MFQEDTVQPMVSITTSDLGEVKTIPLVASKLTVQLTEGFWQRPLNKLKKKKNRERSEVQSCRRGGHSATSDSPGLETSEPCFC